MTPFCMLGIQLTLFAHLAHLSEVEYTLVYTKHLLGVSKQGKHNTVSYFYINIFKFLKILSSFFTNFTSLLAIFSSRKGGVGGRGGVLESNLLGMCLWPLRTPTLLQSILWPIIDLTVVTFWKLQCLQSQSSHFPFMHKP